MPQVIILALAGLGAVTAARWLSKRMAASGSKAAPKPTLAPKDLGALKRDPKTGDYRPE